MRQGICISHRDTWESSDFLKLENQGPLHTPWVLQCPTAPRSSSASTEAVLLGLWGFPMAKANPHFLHTLVITCGCVFPYLCHARLICRSHESSGFWTALGLQCGSEAWPAWPRIPALQGSCSLIFVTLLFLLMPQRSHL